MPLPGPYDVTVNETSQDIFVSLSSGDIVVRVFASNGTLSVIAGTGVSGCDGNASVATLTRMKHPTSLSLDGRGGLIIADRRCCLLRRLELSSGNISVIAGGSNSGARISRLAIHGAPLLDSMQAA